MTQRSVVISLEAILLTIIADEPYVLTVSSTDFLRELHVTLDHDPWHGRCGFPAGLLDPTQLTALERLVHARVVRQTGVHPGYLEQLYTFADPERMPGDDHGLRLISIAYLGLCPYQPFRSGKGAAWHRVYGYLPWEDWRCGEPQVVRENMRPHLTAWLSRQETRPRFSELKERMEMAFFHEGEPWVPERALERYELLYQSGCVAESEPQVQVQGMGNPMIMDHRRMLATALTRIRGKIKYRPVVFELLPNQFTLFDLQHVVEALSGMKLHKQNFRRLMAEAGLVEETEETTTATGGRPARLYRFRRDVLREPVSPGTFHAQRFHFR